jgi:ribosomal protein S18 acetylase RimI-like enzyme
MHVIRLTSADVARYRDLMLHAYTHAPDSFTSTAEERALEPESWWANRIDDSAGLSAALGAFHDGALVGSVTIEFSPKPKTRHKAHLIGMYVLESSRRLGVGKALVKAALELAIARQGILIVTLAVTEGNEQAIDLYRSFGFEKFGLEPMAIRTEDGFRSRVHMWRPLGENAAA